MIALDTNTKTLQIVLAGAKNTNDAQVVASYEDRPATASTNPTVGHEVATVTSGVTPAAILPAPGQGFIRVLKSLSVYNADLASITLTLYINDSSGGSISSTILKQTRLTLETLTYEDGAGFLSYDATGAIITQAAATSSSTSTADSKAVSAGTAASVADFKAVSDSANISVALSTGVSSSTAGSSSLSTLTSRVSSKGG